MWTVKFLPLILHPPQFFYASYLCIYTATCSSLCFALWHVWVNLLISHRAHFKKKAETSLWSLKAVHKPKHFHVLTVLGHSPVLTCFCNRIFLHHIFTSFSTKVTNRDGIAHLFIPSLARYEQIFPKSQKRHTTCYCNFVVCFLLPFSDICG